MASFTDLTPVQQNAFLNSPVLEPPKGQVSNLINPSNGTAASEAVFAIAFGLSTIAVAGRIYARFILLKHRFLSDYFLILGYLILVALYAYVERMAQDTGMFVHLWNVRWEEFIMYLRGVFITSLLYIFAILSIKIAIPLEWLNLFVSPGTRGFVFWAVYITIGVNVAFYLSVFIVNQVACVPYEYSWNKLIDGNCDRANTRYTNLVSGVFNVISDFIILAILQKVEACKCNSTQQLA